MVSSDNKAMTQIPNSAHYSFLDFHYRAGGGDVLVAGTDVIVVVVAAERGNCCS